MKIVGRPILSRSNTGFQPSALADAGAFRAPKIAPETSSFQFADDRFLLNVLKPLEASNARRRPVFGNSKDLTKESDESDKIDHGSPNGDATLKHYRFSSRLKLYQPITAKA
jgi:hypothetical protein